MMIPILLILELFPRQIMQLFDASEYMMGMGIPAVRIFGISCFLSVVGLVGATVCQSMGKGTYSLCISVSRQAAIPLLLAWLLSGTGRITLVWTAFVAAEILAAPMTGFFLRRIQKTVLDPMQKQHGKNW